MTELEKLIKELQELLAFTEDANMYRLINRTIVFLKQLKDKE